MVEGQRQTKRNLCAEPARLRRAKRPAKRNRGGAPSHHVRNPADRLFFATLVRSARLQPQGIRIAVQQNPDRFAAGNGIGNFFARAGKAETARRKGGRYEGCVRQPAANGKICLRQLLHHPRLPDAPGHGTKSRKNAGAARLKQVYLFRFIRRKRRMAAS